MNTVPLRGVLSCTGRRPVRTYCALQPSRDAPPRKTTPLAASLQARATCSVNRQQAAQFNKCFINFESLDEKKAQHCVEVAEEILAVDCETSICDEDVCTERSHVDWFKSYMSNAFGF